MAGQSLQIRLAQKLALAPQLQQAIRLLQLNRIELREYIQEAVDANPLLERTEAEGSEEGSGDALDSATSLDNLDDFGDYGSSEWGEDQPGMEKYAQDAPEWAAGLAVSCSS